MKKPSVWVQRAIALLTGRAVSACLLAALTLAAIGYVNVRLRVFTVVDGDTSRSVAVLSGNPEVALAAAGISLEEGDSYETASARKSNQICVKRAYNVRVTVDGSTRLVRMTEGTVDDALALAGVQISRHDKTNLDRSVPVSEGLDICVDRVTYQEYTETKTVAYETVTRYSNTVRKGNTVTVQAGKAGKTVYTYRKRIVNGKAVGTELVSKEIVSKPVDKIVLKGTVLGTPMSKAPFEIELDEAGQPVHYKKMFEGKATAYTARKGKGTATGRLAQVGVIAVDPKKIPYGSKLYVTSPSGSYVYGYAIAGDTGNGVRSGRTVADLYMNTVAECYQFGCRTMRVYVLE